VINKILHPKTKNTEKGKTMSNSIKLFIINVIGILIISACSSTPLQTTRLNKAETYIIQAEQALAANRINIAVNDMGTAKAYLDTLKDNLKFLSKTEVKRYNELRAREKVTATRVRFQAY